MLDTLEKGIYFSVKEKNEDVEKSVSTQYRSCQKLKEGYEMSSVMYLDQKCNNFQQLSLRGINFLINIPSQIIFSEKCSLRYLLANILNYTEGITPKKADKISGIMMNKALELYDFIPNSIPQLKDFLNKVLNAKSDEERFPNIIGAFKAIQNELSEADPYGLTETGKKFYEDEYERLLTIIDSVSNKLEEEGFNVQASGFAYKILNRFLRNFKMSMKSLQNLSDLPREDYIQMIRTDSQMTDIMLKHTSSDTLKTFLKSFNGDMDSYSYYEPYEFFPEQLVNFYNMAFTQLSVQELSSLNIKNSDGTTIPFLKLIKGIVTSIHHLDDPNSELSGQERRRRLDTNLERLIAAINDAKENSKLQDFTKKLELIKKYYGANDFITTRIEGKGGNSYFLRKRKYSDKNTILDLNDLSFVS